MSGFLTGTFTVEVVYDSPEFEMNSDELEQILDEALGSRPGYDVDWTISAVRKVEA